MEEDNGIVEQLCGDNSGIDFDGEDNSIIVYNPAKYPIAESALINTEKGTLNLYRNDSGQPIKKFKLTFTATEMQ